VGAPNVVRGGTHLNWAAAPLAVRGLVTVLASDDDWPSLLDAPFVLAARNTPGLPDTWALVAEDPVAAANLLDRGRLSIGLHADVVVVDPTGLELFALCARDRLAYLGAAGAARLSSPSGSASQANRRKSSPQTAFAP